MDTGEWIALASIPVFTGVVGWLINWSGVIMLFNPVHFHGRTIPGLRELSTLLPHKLQEVPGIMQGGIGWQGIVPARAAKMGSIAVDKAIAKLGTPAEFYEELGPQSIADQIVSLFGPELPRIIEEIMMREEPDMWNRLPPQAREAVVARVRDQLPSIAEQMTTEIGLYVDQLLDPKILVIDHFTRNPELVVKIFRDFGQKELNLMINFGFIFGFLLGIPVAIIDHTFHQWWLLPILGVFVGWTTNLLGMQLIFEPVEPKRILGIKVHGLFLRRQDEAAEVYAQIIADDVITLETVGDFLLNGPRGDRTKQMIEDAMVPIIDRALGPARGAVRVAVGSREYDTITTAFAQEAVEQTMTPFQDPDFARTQSENIRAMVAQRTKELPPRDFVEMMRSAIKEDEWMLYAHGALMGAAGGFIHLAIFGVSG